jgi:Flp pilus assembly protein TadG
MRTNGFLLRIWRLLRAPEFIRDLRAVTAVEFALIAPIALLLLFGEFALCQAMSTKRKLTITAQTIGDLIARQSSVSATQLSAILNASAQIAAPYSISSIVIVVAELTTDASGNTTVTWSNTLNGTALTAGSKVTLPAGIAQAGTSIIYSIASYSFTPLLGQNLFGTMTFSSKFYENPRVSATVNYTN